MTTLWSDVRYGVRMLGKSPGFTAVAVATLALGIGANTAIFSLIDALLLRSLPGVKDPQQLVLVTDNGEASLSYSLYELSRDGNRSLSGLCTAAGVNRCKMIIAGPPSAEAESVWTQAVSGDFFATLGVSALVGRTLTPDDDRPGDPHAAVVISHSLWQRRFRQDPAVIGATITLKDVPFTIVGVAPRGFFGFNVGSRPDLWWPIQMIGQVEGTDAAEWISRDKGWQSTWVRIMGRLKSGVSNEQARAELDVIFHQMRSAAADEMSLSGPKREEYLRNRIVLEAGGTGYSELRGEFQKPLSLLIATVGLVALVACANVAGLLLARGATRQREFSVRSALGAGRLTLARQLITESLLLAGLGGALGLLLAQWGVHLLTRYVPGYGDTIQLTLTPDLRILAFTFAVSVFTGVLFGLIPAWRGSRPDLAAPLKNQAGSLTDRESKQRWNQALVVAQIALSCCLLIGATLFVRTLQKLQALDVGLDRRNLLVFALDLGKEYDNNRRANLCDQVLRRLEGVPGVKSASMSSLRSLSGSEWGWGPTKVIAEGSGLNMEEGMDVRGTAVGARYFETMGIPLLRGRGFGPQDEPLPGANQAVRPVIIDETSARVLFGQENPLGRLLRGRGRGISWPPLEVIGVVKDVVHKDVRSGVRISLYGLETCRSASMHFFHVRTLSSPLSLAGALREIVRQLDPKVEVDRLQTADDLFSSQLLRERAVAQVASFFGLSALALTCIGLYGILSYGVTRRTREIGLRMALGAQKYGVFFLVIRHGMVLALVGCGLGVILAVVLTRVVSSLLYGVTPTDPLTFLLTVLLLGAVAFVSCWLPARRAAKIDPMVALRCE